MGNKIFKDVASYIIIASVFVTGSGEIFPQLNFRFYWYYPFYIAFTLYGLLAYRKINIKFISAFCVLALFAALTYTFGFNLVIKQLVNILISILVFYTLICHENFEIEAIFQKYITFSKGILIIGLIQVVLYTFEMGAYFVFFFPFLEGIAISSRLQSITQEPSYIALTFAPIVCISLHNLFYRRSYLISPIWSAFFVMGYLLTMSAVAYTGFIVLLFVLYFKRLTLQRLQLSILTFGGIFLMSYASYVSISAIRERVDDTIYGLSNDISKGDTYLRLNLSSYALLSNLYVTRKNLETNILTGSGLGTHQMAYDMYMPVHIRSYRFYGLNKEDANSMFLRLLSEIGVVGLIFFCLFVANYKLKYHNSFTPQQEILWVVNAGIFVLIALALLRNGNYTSSGKFLFLMLYYYSYKQAHLSPEETNAPEKG